MTPFERDTASDLLDEANDDPAAEGLRDLLATARTHIESVMQTRGLTQSGGWRLYEKTRADATGTSVLIAPIHRREPPPANLCCVVKIDQRSAKATVHCDCDPPLDALQ